MNDTTPVQGITAEKPLASATSTPAALAFLNLTKPRITFLVVLSALAGFALATSSPVPWGLFIRFTLGIAILSSGIGALNQYWERNLDKLMARTKIRPLPQGQITPHRALAFGILLAAIAEAWLAWFVNPLTAILGLVALSRRCRTWACS